MRYRKLGRTGFEVSEIGYGAWGVGGIQWRGASDDSSLEALRAALDCGLNFIDTALAYGEGHSERLVGQVIRESGRRVLVATKVPPKNQLWPARPGIGIERVFPYQYILDSTDRSLKNLGLEAVELQQLHVWNPEWLDREEWRRAAEDLKRAGKIRAFGVSINDHQPDSALELIRTGLVDTVQVIYNIFDQTPEKNLFPLAMERNIGVLARVPLDEGALAGAIDEKTRFDPQDFRAGYFRGERKRAVAEHVAALKRDLAGAGVDEPLAETALRFAFTHPAVSTVIPGMRTAAHARSNCALSDRGPLPEAVREVLRRHAWDRNFYD
jgi:aryl-alcohol dehydrogenase-like predicted oxidoreductase